MQCGLSKKEFAVMRVLLWYFGKDGRLYKIVRQETVVNRCKKWFGVRMSRRQFNRVAKRLETIGLMDRVRRHRRSARGTLLLRATLYQMGRAGFSLLGMTSSVVKSFQTILAVTGRALSNTFQGKRSFGPVDNSGRNDHLRIEGAARSGPIVLKFNTI